MDPTNAGEWVTIHRGLQGPRRRRLRQGYRMDQRLCLRGVNFDVHWKLVEVDVPRYALWEGKGPARSKARIVDRLSENGNGGTHFDYENEFQRAVRPARRGRHARAHRRRAPARGRRFTQAAQGDPGARDVTRVAFLGDVLLGADAEPTLATAWLGVRLRRDAGGPRRGRPRRGEPRRPGRRARGAGAAAGA